MKRWTDERIRLLPIPSTGKKATAIGAGLYVMTYPSGRQSWARMERNANGHNQAHAFAPVRSGRTDTSEGALTLLEAQAACAAHAVKAAAELAVAVARQTRNKATITFGLLIEDFLINKIEPRNDIAPERKRRYRHTLTAHFARATIPTVGGRWADLKVSAFTGGDWFDRYDQTLFNIERASIATGDRRGRSTLGNEVDAFMQKVFAYAIRRGFLLAEHLPERNKEVRRPQAITRYLSIAEIERLLQATSPEAVAETAGKMNELDACFMRVLLASGIRLNSVRLARRSNMHVHAKDFWTFPSEDLKQTKAQREAPADHHIPLTELLQRELARLEAILPAGCDAFFPERYHLKREPEQAKPRSDSWAKHLLEEFATSIGNVSKAQPYTAHAFRRTQSNMMRELAVPDAVIDLCQARVPRDTAKTYLTAELRDQVQNAFELYHDFLEACMHGQGEDFMQAVRDRRRATYLKERASIRKEIGMKSLTVIRGGKPRS